MATIYRVRRIVTDECYVGSTALRPGVRWGQHLYLLRKGDHHATRLQASFDMDGEVGLVFEIIEECLDEDRCLREQYHIDTGCSCLNANRFATEAGKFGYRLTAEQIARCSAAQLGIAHPYFVETLKVWRERSPANKPGWTPEHRIGVKDSPAVVEKRRQSVLATKSANPAVWITNGADNRQRPIAEPIPEGWRRGRTFREGHNMFGGKRATSEALRVSHEAAWQDPEKRARMLGNRQPFCWINDGTTSRRHYLSEPIPDGWRQGRIIDASKLVAARRSKIANQT